MKQQLICDFSQTLELPSEYKQTFARIGYAVGHVLIQHEILHETCQTVVFFRTMLICEECSICEDREQSQCKHRGQAY